MFKRMENFSLPRRTGVKTNLEKEFDLLYQEIGLALLKRSQESLELRNLVHTLTSKINQLEADKNDSKQKNDYLIAKLDALENSCETQKKVMLELQEAYDKQKLNNKEELRSLKIVQSQLKEENEEAEKNLTKVKMELKAAKSTKEKLERELKDFEIKLNYKDQELKNLRSKFPNDTEVEKLAQNMADNFLKEESQRYDEGKREIMTKIREIENNFFKKQTNIFGK